ncbi:TetR/AcrR family transcriptional regulator [Cellulosimicrobium protaetiae]|uniref:TetR family transcriptional regulator n=1 Tax=Cellulosimicrobium protaetiae TaxID=2587808 RepID=A0A6M5UDF2_9MICO|nr:TetR family transcriptional regulator [Cellulosimicrobium protaetiae]QJW35235.1 TetR family transcriptional regulator [Cellulosimicrobium protaetiae]
MLRGTVVGEEVVHVRADAVRNRESLVRAAGSVLAESGLDVPVAAIADRAGVAKGTVFRHFASKDELVVTVVAGLIDDLAARAETLLAEPDPLTALREFVAAGVELQARDLAFCQVAAAAEQQVPGLTDRRLRLEQIADLLVRRAQDAGAVRADLTGRDVVGLMTAAYQGACATGDPLRWPYFLSVLVDGLHPTGQDGAGRTSDRA